jgi:hypothetical protein
LEGLNSRAIEMSEIALRSSVGLPESRTARLSSSCRFRPDDELHLLCTRMVRTRSYSISIYLKPAIVYVANKA